MWRLESSVFIIGVPSRQSLGVNWVLGCWNSTRGQLSVNFSPPGYKFSVVILNTRLSRMASSTRDDRSITVVVGVNSFDMCPCVFCLQSWNWFCMCVMVINVYVNIGAYRVMSLWIIRLYCACELYFCVYVHINCVCGVYVCIWVFVYYMCLWICIYIPVSCRRSFVDWSSEIYLLNNFHSLFIITVESISLLLGFEITSTGLRLYCQKIQPGHP